MDVECRRRLRRMLVSFRTGCGDIPGWLYPLTAMQTDHEGCHRRGMIAVGHSIVPKLTLNTRLLLQSVHFEVAGAERI